ncbi:hypothetical protein SSX86_005644 [Deinandra increscens subsp. villosa]|uniref:F-box domain-containing protein n=1 Tax=Deinandra increscens subsp. villosa TaxID=3103831 RepID=A0AAP0HA96_9ASTR
MSDNIPFELQLEIIKRLPVEPLLRFRSVSKTWKSLIDSSDFTADYAGKGHLGLGFGVCRETNDPKIVNIRHVSREEDPQGITSIPWQVQVFNLSTGAWRSVFNNLPRNSVKLFRHPPAFIDKFLYWVATDKITMDGGVKSCCNLIISFDITSEEFGQVDLPDTLARDRYCGNLRVSKLRKSLVVIEECRKVDDDPTFFVWMMEDGDSKSFTKLFGIHTPDALIVGVLEFRKSGEPILEVGKRDYSWYALCQSRLVDYEPYSKHIGNLGIDGKDFVFDVSSYMETLLLHDHPNFTVYDEGNKSSFYEWRSEKSRSCFTS